MTRRYKGRGETPQLWEPKYLEVLEQTGNKSMAAKAADVSVRNVKLLRETNPAFKERWDAAYDHYLDKVETELGEMKNPIAKIARLRADRPARYLDKLQVAATVGVTHFSPKSDEIRGLLTEMLRDLSPESIKELKGEVVEAEPIQPVEVVKHG